MDANHTASGTQRIAPWAVVLAFVFSAAVARAEAPVPAPVPPAASGSQDGEAAVSTAEAECAVLAAILLIPPPIDLITEIPKEQPDDTHPIVVEGPDLHIDTIPGGVNGQVLHTQTAPEPATLVLGVIGSGVAAAGAWYRRRRLLRQAKEVEAVAMAA